jgi:hypothetical protein
MAARYHKRTSWSKTTARRPFADKQRSHPYRFSRKGGVAGNWNGRVTDEEGKYDAKQMKSANEEDMNTWFL